MDFVIANELDYPVHVTLVEHSELSIEIVLSMGQVPVPTGRPIRREMLEPGQGLGLKDLSAKLRLALDRRKLPDDILAVRIRGKTKKDIPFVLVTLRPKEGGSGEDT